MERENKTLLSCSRCKSIDIVQDANLHVNTGEYSVYDQMQCCSCGYDGHNFHEHNVPEDFDPDHDKLPEPA